jgi:ligand-binding sensor domain-containing protein/signal transduction histidine kinase
MVMACAGADPARATPAPQLMDAYVHSVWTTENGLPQNSVYAMVQSRDGFLWLGTDEGLVRFDGLRFVVYDRSNTPALVDQSVFALHEGRDGSLWTGTDRGGLTRLKGGQFSHYGTDKGLPAARVQAITDGASGTLWVGLRGAGLARLAGDRFELFGTREGLSSNNVLSVFEDTRGQLWVGTDRGLDRFENGRFVASEGSSQLAAGGVRAIYEDTSRRLWIGVVGGEMDETRVAAGGLSVYENGRFRRVRQPAGLPSGGVTSMVEDADGSLWLGTPGGGIARVRQGRYESWSHVGTQAADMVYALARDREGGLWIGTQPGGLHRLHSSAFRTHTKKDGLVDEVVESLFEDRHGTVWVGTHGGVCRRNGTRLTCLTSADGLADNRVNAIAEDADGTVWLGTASGLNRVQNGTITRYTTRDGLPADNINALLRDRSGVLWVGTWGGGVAQLDQNRFEGQATNASGRYVNVLYQGSTGPVWIGTTQGLSYVANGMITDATETLGMPTAVEAVYEDADRQVWIGTRRDGLFRYAAGRLTQYTVQHGLFDNLVGTILEDGDGNFWFTCNKGIFRISRRQLLEFAEGTRRSVESRAFDTADGMKNRECNFGQGRWKTRDGRLWFATVGGVVVVDPVRVALNPVPPRVSIEGMLADGAMLAAPDLRHIAFGTGRFEFQFVGISFTAPARVRYRYKIDGYDEGWVDGRDARVASYTKLPPGAYRFQVIAANSEGVWNAEGASLEFTIAGPIWRRPWFAASILGLSAALVVLIGQRRVTALRRQQATQAEFSRQLISSQENERRRLAGELHDGIGQHLLIINNWAKLAVESPESLERATSLLNVIAETATLSIRDIRTITHELQPYELEHIGLEGAIHAMLARIGDVSGVSFTTNIEPIEDVVTSEAAIHVYRIVQEAANNTIRHSKATEASVAIRRTRFGAELQVSDNGCGFTHGAKSDPVRSGGFGLRSLAARARLLGGTHRIDTRPGEGTRVSVTIYASKQLA